MVRRFVGFETLALAAIVVGCGDGRDLLLGKQWASGGSTGSIETGGVGGATTGGAVSGLGGVDAVTGGIGGNAGGTGCNPLQQTCIDEFEIQPYLQPCVGLGLGSCMMQKRGDSTQVADSIQGFQFEWGYTTGVRVRLSPIPDPPADGSSISRELLAVLSKTAVQPGETFELKLAPIVHSLDELRTLIAGDCSRGFTLFPDYAGKPTELSKELVFDQSLSCEEFEEWTRDSVPESLTLAFSTPEGPLHVSGMLGSRVQNVRVRPYLLTCKGIFFAYECLSAEVEGSAEPRGVDWVGGFDFEWGYEYELSVLTTRRDYRIQDLNDSRDYRLLEVKEKRLAPPGIEFALYLGFREPYDEARMISGSCADGFSLFGAAPYTKPLSFEDAVSCETLQTALAEHTLERLGLRLDGPSAPLTVTALWRTGED